MNFADSSFLCALYRRQDNSDEAADFVENNDEPITISGMVAFEFRQATRLQVFRFKSNRTRGFPLAEAREMLSDFAEDLASGLVRLASPSWVEVHARAEELSAKHTIAHGYRTFDVLHVASALEIGAARFLSFDGPQRNLAEVEGLTVLPRL